jgi:hypothetical protein
LKIYKNTTALISDAQPLLAAQVLQLQLITGYVLLLQVRPVYSFYRFRTDPLKTTLVTSQLRHPLQSNGLLRVDRPTENPASNSVTVLLRSNVQLVTMEMKSTSRCIATDICRLSLMWEAPTILYKKLAGEYPSLSEHEWLWRVMKK